jgi:hypothetical protein
VCDCDRGICWASLAADSAVWGLKITAENSAEWAVAVVGSASNTQQMRPAPKRG